MFFFSLNKFAGCRGFHRVYYSLVVHVVWKQPFFGPSFLLPRFVGLFFLRWAKSRESYRRIASESYRGDSNR